MTVVVRSAAEPGTVMAAARAELATVDRTLPLFNPTSFEDAVLASATRPQLSACLVGAFAGAALVLAVIGIYGVIAYAVRERQRELGIRLALGARRAQVVGLVLGQELRLAACGVGIGIVVAVVGSRTLRGVLYGVGPTDLTTYGAVCGALVVVVALVSWVPARRAAGVDPMIALRPE